MLSKHCGGISFFISKSETAGLQFVKGGAQSEHFRLLESQQICPKGVDRVRNPSYN